MKVKSDHRSKFSNLSDWREEAWKKIRASTGLNKLGLNKLTSLPMCGFIAQLVEHRTGIAEVTGSSPLEDLIFFQPSSIHLLKLENLLRWSLFTFMNVQCQRSTRWTKASRPCQPIIRMATILRNSTVIVAVVVAVVVVLRVHRRAIPLAMITMRKSIHGFH